MAVNKSIAEIPTIDCSLVTIGIDTGVQDPNYKGVVADATAAGTALTASGEWCDVTSTSTEWIYDSGTSAAKNTGNPIGTTPHNTYNEFGFDTANQVTVEPVINTTDAVELIVKGILRAKKGKIDTITGNTITLSDNVFNPQLVLALQGGTIIYDPADNTKIIGYDPPVSGSEDRGEVFMLNVYSAQYNPAGLVVNYEKITYPNCQGQPVAFSAEDGVFRTPSYTIDSAPDKGEKVYMIRYVDNLPQLS